jgi:hypothetical protein
LQKGFFWTKEAFLFLNCNNLPDFTDLLIRLHLKSPVLTFNRKKWIKNKQKQIKIKIGGGQVEKFQLLSDLTWTKRYIYRIINYCFVSTDTNNLEKIVPDHRLYICIQKKSHMGEEVVIKKTFKWYAILAKAQQNLIFWLLLK